MKLNNIKFKIVYKQGEDTMTMYSNYLTEVGKLVYILGQIEITSTFKKMLDSNNDQKSKIFFKCLDELPPGTYRKIKVQCRRKGILRCDWFNKILDKSPMMIFMVFNYTQPLDPNQKWQDRLSITIKKINKAYDILRSHPETILRIMIIIKKQAVLQSNQSGNIQQKILTFLKVYEKEILIIQSDQLAKEIAKNKLYWFSALDKAYERKYRVINKRKDQSFGERRLGCLVKMAVISEIISKKDSQSQYDEAYRSLHFRFNQAMKNKIQCHNFDAIRQVRTMADIVFLRRLIVKMAVTANYQNVAESINNHLQFFYQAPQSDYFFFNYQNIIWRQNFLQNLLQVLYTNEPTQVISKNSYLQLINSAISLSYKLCKSSKQLEPILNKELQIKGRMIPCESPVYIGSRNYSMGVQITELDVIWTEMNDLLDRKKDFITRGLQTITRYKSQKTFKKHELSFFNIYLLRFYLADEKLSGIGRIFNHIIKQKINQSDFYSLNYLIEELERQTQKSSEHRIMIHSLAILISDYFRNKEQLQKYGDLLMKSILRVDTNFKKKKNKKSQSINLLDLSNQQLTEQVSESDNIGTQEKQPLVLPLQSQSLIFSLEVLFPHKLHMIQKELSIVIKPKFQNQFLINSGTKAKLKLFFNKSQIQSQYEINFAQFRNDMEIVLKINPLEYFSKDELLELHNAVLITQTIPALHFFVQSITFPKHSSVILITKLTLPQITIMMPYEIYYLYQTSKFVIKTEKVDPSTKIQITFTVTEEGGHNTEVFVNLNDRLNLVNSEIPQPVQNGAVTYLKGNKIGARILKFVFNITLVQTIGNKNLRDVHVVNKQVGFRIVNLFKTIKQLKQSITGAELKHNEIPTNKTIIMSYTIRSVQTVQILELNQHKSPKPYFKSYKDISPIQNYLLPPEERLKSIYIFEILQQLLRNQQKKDLFLISFYIKWQRVDMDKKLGLNTQFAEQIVNVFNQDEVKVGARGDKVEVGYEQGKVLKKRIKNTLGIKYRNLTGERIHIYSIMDNSQQILRIGSRAKQAQLGPRQTKTITFQILPVKGGYFKYPQVRSFFDGKEAKQKTCNNIICVI